MPEQEAKAFFKYASALSGNGSIASSLTAYLKAQYPKNLNSQYFNKERIIRVLHEKKARRISWKSITEANSRLCKLLEDFLILQKLSPKSGTEPEKTNSRKRRDLLLLEIYQEHGAHHLFELQANLLQQAVREPVYLSIWSILDQLYLNHLLYYSTINTKKKETAAGHNRLVQLTQQLEEFRALASMLYQTELKNRQNVLKGEASINDNHQESPDPMPSEVDTDSPYSLLHHALKLADELTESYSDPAKYESLKDFFAEHRHRFAPDFQMMLHGYGINFVSRQGATNEAYYIDLLHNWYRNDELNEMLLKHNLLTPTRFLNTIATACAFQRVDWAESFLKKNGPQLPEDTREVTYGISAATVAFHKNQFDRVHEHLSKRTKVPPRFEVRARALQLMAFVEQKADHSIIMDHCKNFLDLLERNGAIGQLSKAGFSNLIKVTKAYVNKKDAKALLEQLQRDQPIFCKSWLEQKLD